MNDLFYFTNTIVTLGGLAQMAAEDGHRVEYVPDVAGSGRWLNVFYEDEGFWQWIPISEAAGDFDGFEPAARAVVAKYGPASAFIIAHHVLSWPTLRPFLKRILDRHGGWIGNDSDAWEPIYTAETIEQRPYPPYHQALQWIEQTGRDLAR